MNAIRILGLTKEYRGRKAVDRLELSIPAGELFALLGVNGAGKSTTIKMLSCLTVPTEGDAELMGHSVRTQPHKAREVLAVSPQETAVALGLPLSWNLLAVVVSLIPSALLFIALGLLCGTLFNDKQVGGVCGAVLTNVTGWLAGIWFDLSLVGGPFQTVAYAFPFVHGADGGKAALAGDWAAAAGQAAIVLVWAAVMGAAAALFRWKIVEHRVENCRFPGEFALCFPPAPLEIPVCVC